MADFYLLDVIGGGHNKISSQSHTDPHSSPSRLHYHQSRPASSMTYKNPLSSDRSHVSAHQLNIMQQEQKSTQSQLNLLRSDNFALHPNLPIIATGAGCMLIIWDLRTDRKTSLIRHTSPISSLIFITDELFPSLYSFSSVQNKQASIRGDSLLISIDSGVSPTLCLWNWQDATLLKHSYLPLKPSPRSLPIANSLIAAKKVANSSYFNILGNSMDSQEMNPFEIETRGNSRFISSGNIASKILSQKQEVGLRSCHSLLLVVQNQNVESGGYRISVWNIGPSSNTQVDKLHEGDEPMKTQDNLITHLFASELQSSSTCLDMCAISNTTSLCSFITVERTCVKFWHISGLHSIKIKKRVHIKQNIYRVACDTLTGFIVILSLSGKILILDADGNYISTIEKENIRFTAVECQAAQQVILGTSKGAIEIYNLASLRFVSSMEYPADLKQRYKLKWQSQMKSVNNSYSSSLKYINSDYEDFMQKMKGQPGASKIFASSNHILTSYQDGSLSIYHRPSLSYLRYSSSHSNRISQVEWLPSSTNSAGQFITASHDLTLRIWKHFGDRWTSSFIDIASSIDASLQHFGSQNMMTSKPHALRITCVIGHPKLHYAMCGDNRGVLRGFNLDTGELNITRDLSSFAISKMAFSQDGELLLVAHSTGLVNVYETSTSFAFLLQLQQHFQDASGESFYQTVMLSTKKYYQEATNNLGTIQFSTVSSSSPRQFSSQKQQRAYTLHNPTTIRSYALLQHLAKKVSAQLLVEYEIGGGTISGATLHPSNDYLIVLSNAGFLLIFRTDTAEIRGRIQVPQFARNCIFDPSGLYLVISAPQPQSSRDGIMNGGDVVDESMVSGIDFANRGNNRNKTSSQCMRLLVFQIGTGNFCSQITSLFKISAFSWSRDGRFLVICGDQGIVSVWGVAQSLSENMFRMMDAVRLDPNCWTAYPIYLDNSFNKADGGPVKYGERNEIVTEIDIDDKRINEQRKRQLLNSLPISSRRQSARNYSIDMRNNRYEKRPDFQVVPDDRSVRSVHSLHPDREVQEISTYHRQGNSSQKRRVTKSYQDDNTTTQFQFQKKNTSVMTQSSKKPQFQSRFMKVSTPTSAQHHRVGGTGVQTGESLLYQNERRKKLDQKYSKQQYMQKESLSHMAQRFTRDLSELKQRNQQSGSDRKQMMIGRNDQLYQRNTQGTPRSAMSAIVSNSGKNRPFYKRDGDNTNSISHIPQRQVTPRTLEHSFLLAKKQQQQQQQQQQAQVERSVQKRKYNTPGRDLLDNTNAKDLYGNNKIISQSLAQRSDIVSKKKQYRPEYQQAVSTLLQEEKQYSGMIRDIGQRIPQGFVNRNRDIKPDPDDIDDQVQAPYVDHAITTISPLVSTGFPRPPQKQVLFPISYHVNVTNQQQKLRQTPQLYDSLKIQKPLQIFQQKPIKSYELGIGHGLQSVKNFDPLLGRTLPNKGVETQSHRSTTDVVEKLYQDLDAFQMANLNYQQQSSEVKSQRYADDLNVGDNDTNDADFQRQE